MADPTQSNFSITGLNEIQLLRYQTPQVIMDEINQYYNYDKIFNIVEPLLKSRYCPAIINEERFHYMKQTLRIGYFGFSYDNTGGKDELKIYLMDNLDQNENSDLRTRILILDKSEFLTLFTNEEIKPLFHSIFKKIFMELKLRFGSNSFNQITSVDLYNFRPLDNSSNIFHKDTSSAYNVNVFTLTYLIEQTPSERRDDVIFKSASIIKTDENSIIRFVDKLFDILSNNPSLNEGLITQNTISSINTIDNIYTRTIAKYALIKPFIDNTISAYQYMVSNMVTNTDTINRMNLINQYMEQFNCLTLCVKHGTTIGINNNTFFHATPDAIINTTNDIIITLGILNVLINAESVIGIPINLLKSVHPDLDNIVSANEAQLNTKKIQRRFIRTWYIDQLKEARFYSFDDLELLLNIDMKQERDPNAMDVERTPEQNKLDEEFRGVLDILNNHLFRDGIQNNIDIDSQMDALFHEIIQGPFNISGGAVPDMTSVLTKEPTIYLTQRNIQKEKTDIVPNEEIDKGTKETLRDMQIIMNNPNKYFIVRKNKAKMGGKKHNKTMKLMRGKNKQ
jgi:hypothetical protein